MKGIQSPYEPRHGAQSPEVLPEHGLDAADAWQGEVAVYLSKRCDMQAPDIFEVLARCEYEEITRMRYLRLARGAMQ